MTRLPNNRVQGRSLAALRLSLSALALSVLLPAPGRTAEPELLAPPSPLQTLGWPSLRDGERCLPLQNAVDVALGPEKKAWSITILNEQGSVLAAVNGAAALIPASNQKLITTAYALDQLGPDFRLRTRLLQRSDGVLELEGEGDPDLGIAGLQRLAMAALGQGGSRREASGSIQLMLREEPPQRWWPRDWPQADRMEAYGAPVTRLALTSNALGMAVQNPAGRFQSLFTKEVQRQGGRVALKVVHPTQGSLEQQGGVDDLLVLHEEVSAPMHSLLSLSNTESHNFTAEVLLREASDQWDVTRASQRAQLWMQGQHLPTSGLRIADGSGLSRSNRVSSQTLAALLLRMHQHPLGPYYQASMAIAGRRGTLRNYFRGSSLDGKLWAKTGTLRGVRSVSGFLETSDGLRFVSLISNGSWAPNETIGTVLKAAQKFSRCSALT